MLSVRFRLRRFAQEGGDVVGEAGWWTVGLVTMRTAVAVAAWRGARAIGTRPIGTRIIRPWFARRGFTAGARFVASRLAATVPPTVAPAVPLLVPWRYAAWNCAVTDRTIRRQAWPTGDVGLITRRANRR